MAHRPGIAWRLQLARARGAVCAAQYLPYAVERLGGVELLGLWADLAKRRLDHLTDEMKRVAVQDACV